ncbi:MAG TPA: Wzz/FepE/Etk N-terminal domain-containing protein [Chthonomonas sp.]|uniref:Wzz/FepE/Etk N-terminal domain-containing protein n=1 Tax=Chthonomonas sp. TaxID=2282153 RepID=UPI002B4ADFF3|nr:Wzz/FepE/Etk N-terminal domain-containing protein [Chthonomonas sp.]HLH80736.1 Wzz/FepE/Etk N-terminal domain-containing protein [Chthonomonas sp.]
MSQNDELILYFDLLAAVVRKYVRLWILVGPALFVAFLILMLLLFPQTYEATVSLSVQHAPNAGSGSSGLSALLGQTSQEKYIGVLKSRRLAEEVEKQIHLKSFYHLRTERDADDLLMHHVVPVDNANDGLLYVSVRLPGPARWALGADLRRTQVKELAAKAANLYAIALQHYYATSDNDRDSVLLRAGQRELERAQAAYHRASERLMAFVQHLKGITPDESPSVDTASTSGALESLYTDYGKTAAEISALEKTNTLLRAGVLKQLSHLSELPADDPLLRTARMNLALAENNYNQLVYAQQLSPTNPQVVQARAQVELARKALQQQEKGYLYRLDTQYIANQARLKALQAQENRILGLIKLAAQHLFVRRELSTQLALLEANQKLALATLQTVEEEAVRLRLSTVSGKSRISVVDSALPPRTGSPGLLTFGALSFILALLPLGYFIVRGYLRAVAERVAPPEFAEEAVLPKAEQAVEAERLPSR